VFRLPALTLLYTGFLSTLPESELRSGFAEVIKHTLISDKSMWEMISSKTLHEQDWDTLIRHSVAFKARVTSEDPTEKGLRKILNAGHTIGHALESYLLNSGNRILHGEAIAVGLIAEGYISLKQDLIGEKSFHQICNYILQIYGKVDFGLNELDAISKLMLQDKKNKDNRILTVLLNGIGRAGWDYEINLAEVKDSLSFYRLLQM